MLYAYSQNRQDTREPAMVVYDVPDGIVIQSERQAEESATVITWVYDGGRVTQYRLNGSPRWRELTT